MTVRHGRLDLFSGLFLEDVREIEIEEGVESFEDLQDKPHINGHVLSGNKTSSELGLASESELINLSTTVAEHNNSLTADINDLSGIVEQNYTMTHQAIDDLHDLIEENVTSLQGMIDDTEDGSIVKIDFEDKGTSKELTVTYGDEETEIVYLNHTHPEYLTQHQDISNLATKSELLSSYSQMAKDDLSNISSAYDYPILTITYGGGESGKTKWRNGRFEQWGVATTSANGETEFTLHEAFKDMKYSIFVEVREMGNWFKYAYPSANQKFKTRISDSYGTVRAVQIQWRAIGYWK